MPELRHLRYFVAVAEELNFSKAARRLRMAQPPLSAAIRQLEAELGTELFRRSSREVALTEAGNVFLDGARRTLAEADRAVVDAKRAGAGELGNLRIGFSWSERFDTLPAVARAFRDSQPDVELLTEEMWNARMIDALRSAAIDVALSLCPETSDGIRAKLVRREGVVAVLAVSHPLADEAQIELASLSDDDFVLFPRELAPRLYDQFVGLCRIAGFEPTVRKESFHTGWDTRVLEELPAAALAPTSVRNGIPEGSVAVPVSDSFAVLETHALSRSNDLSPVVSVFLEVATTMFEPVGRA